MTRLSDKLETAMKAYREVGLSMPGEPAWIIEQEKRTAAGNRLHSLLHESLPTIIAALRERGE